jgi:hypothetical protein
MNDVAPRSVETVRRPGLVSILKWTAGIFALLMLLQAFLGSRGFFLDSDLLDVHQTVGMITVLVALIQIAVAIVVVGPSRATRPIVIISAAIFILAVVQLMLGFSAKDGNGGSAAWHILNGVFIFGLAVGNNSMIFRLPRD